jgi:hypothetical protein
VPAHKTTFDREVAVALDLGLTLRPAFNRCRIMLRSNSEKPSVTWKSSLLVGVVVRRASSKTT